MDWVSTKSWLFCAVTSGSPEGSVCTEGPAGPPRQLWGNLTLSAQGLTGHHKNLWAQSWRQCCAAVLGVSQCNQSQNVPCALGKFGDGMEGGTGMNCRTILRGWRGNRATWKHIGVQEIFSILKTRWKPKNAQICRRDLQCECRNTIMIDTVSLKYGFNYVVFM